MADRTQISITFLDGGELEVTTALYMCTADLVVFERKYDVPAQQLQIARAQRRVKTEWVAFFSWLAIRRDGARIPDDFDEFVATVATLKLEDLAEPAAEGDASPPVSGPAGPAGE
jgi:hypothetical protein